ncbi:MAG: AAA family ATPase [Lachnospiraceae bacterium]
MKPLKLTIKGLNSFVETQTIDFEELSSKGIFGIFGPTGSGKSTILDGITLALYGDLARKSNGFVNSGEEVRQANVSLVFQISSPNPRIFQVDRTFVKNKDASKKPVSKSVLKEHRSGQIEVLEEGTSAVNEACEKLIGLKKEDFLRTVVLPQGKFSEFLMLTGKERNEMLERLFRLEEYGEQLSERIGEEKKILSHEIENLRGRLSGYEEISKEILEERRENRTKWEQEYQALSETAEQLKQVLEEKQALRKLLEEQSLYERRLNKLLARNSQVLDWENKLALAEEIQSIKPVKELCRQKEQELGAALSVLETRMQEASLAEVKLRESTCLKQKNTAVKRQNDLLDRQEQNRVSASLRKNIQEGALTERELQKNGQEQKQAEDLQAGLIKKIEGLEQEWNQMKKQEERLSEAIAGCWKDEQERMTKALKSTLKEGEPCPVCGFICHDLPSVPQGDGNWETETKDSSRQIEQFEQEKERLQKEISQIQLEWSAGKAKLETAEDHLRELSDKRREWTIRLKRLSEENQEKRKFSGLTFETMQKQVEDMDRQSERLRIELERAERETGNVQEELEAISRKTMELELCKARLETRQAETETAMLRLQAEIVRLIGQEKGSQKELDKISEEIETIQKAGKQAEAEFERRRQAETKAKEAVKVAEAGAAYAKTAWEEAKSQLLQGISNCPRLKEELAGAASDMETVLETWELEADRAEQLKEEIRRYREETAALSSQLEEKKNQIQGQTLDETEWQKVTAAVQQMERDLEEKRTEGIRLLDSVAQGQIRLKEKEKLLREYEKKEHRQALVSQLEGLIKGKRFVEYAAKEKLQYVSREASVLLYQLSCGIYELECNEQGYFQIVDFKNGGIRRAVNTLSGGEVFLASLSLALALSAQIQLSSHASLELFFLDEGFGTLDDNLLDVVMEALEHLRSLSSRAIGLITHVERIQNQMPVKLLVKPAESGGKGSRTELAYS